MNGLVYWIIVGLIAGWLAGQVMKGGGYGVVGDMIVGIVGALLGGFLAAWLFGVQEAVNGVNLISIVTAFLGAIVLIAVVRALPGRSSAPRTATRPARRRCRCAARAAAPPSRERRPRRASPT